MPRTAWRQLERVRVADPYFEWGRRTGFRYFSGGAAPQDFPVIMELAIPADKFASGDWERPPPKDWRRLIQVPSTYRNPPPGLEAASFCTASVRQDFFDRLPREPALNATILNVELALRVEPGVEVMRALAPTVWPAGAVVTGVIDDGLGFAHERLRLGAEPRMEFLWNQDGPTRPPIGFAYGLELQKQDTALAPGMKKQMADNTFAGLVDEDEVYRKTRHLQYERLGHKPLAARASHGTHVMDVACGFDPATVSDKRPLIGVQLPVKTTADTSGGSLAHYVLDGMRYILRRTTKVPTVVNVSYALIAGPHDGSSVLERSIDQLIALREAAGLPFAVVLPAGNHFLSRCHARFKTSSAGRRMRWRVMPDDPTPSFLELWLPKTPAGAKVRIRVRTPTGDVSPWITQGGVWTWQPAAQVLCEVVYHVAPAPGISRNMILIAIAPTTSDDATELAPSGTWEIEVRRNGVASVVDAWIQRDDTAFGYPTRGRQSRFEDEKYERFDEPGRELEVDNPQSYVKRDGTINPIATGRRTVVIGGIHYQDWRAAKNSAGGSVIRPPGRGAPNTDGPDAMTISDGSPAHYGILAAGSRSGSTVAMSGTSVAAPQIARWIADQMATGQAHDRQAVSQFAQAGVAAGYRTEANPPPGASPKPPATRSGGGRIESPQIVDREIER